MMLMNNTISGAVKLHVEIASNKGSRWQSGSTTSGYMLDAVL